MGNYTILQMPEKGLIEAAKRGSVEAFEQLIRPNQKKMLSLSQSLAYSFEDAEDIYQEAMLSAFKAIPNFRLESQFVTWLYRIVVNTACNSRRKLKSKLNQLFVRGEHDFDNSVNQLQSVEISTSSNPEQSLVNQQLSDAINQALESLSKQEKIAFVICHQQGFKMKDAAEIMGCGEGSVKRTLFRAREKMRIQLKDFKR
jgi:RNA polymerase sigma-70 factor (ECF subfamily)